MDLKELKALVAVFNKLKVEGLEIPVEKEDTFETLGAKFMEIVPKVPEGKEPELDKLPGRVWDKVCKGYEAVEAELKTRAEVAKEPEEKKTPTPRKKEEKKPKATPPPKKVEPKAKKAAGKGNGKEKSERDEFGIRVGSKAHEAFKLFKTGKFTMKEVSDKLEASGGFNDTLKRIKGAGHKVTVDDKGKIKVVAA